MNSSKLYSNSSGKYSETKEYKILCCGNIEGNNNKYYAIEIQYSPDDDNYRIFTHYGRINSTNIYEERGSFYDYSSVKKEYDSIIKKKLRGKKIKEDGETRVEKYEEIDILSPTVGSSNIVGKSSKIIIDVPQIITKDNSFDKETKRILKQFAEENIHQIKSVTSLQFTDRGFETPLGMVTEYHLERSRNSLMGLKRFIKNGSIDPGIKEVRDLNNLYYSLIPHDFGRKIKESDWILGDDKIINEFDLIDQLETAVKIGLNSKSDVSDQFNKFGTDIKLYKDRKEIDRIFNKIETSRKHRDLNSWKPANLFKVGIKSVKDRYVNFSKKLGNIKEFFHGSQNKNLLSILTNGLIIPPYNAGYVTGRMFGDGVYGADASTKALNYSVGYWSGKSNKYNNSFLIIVDFAMGKTYDTYSSLSSGAPRGYDSVSALSGKTLINNEYIVYNIGQVDIKYLVELTKK